MSRENSVRFRRSDNFLGKLSSLWLALALGLVLTISMIGNSQAQLDDFKMVVLGDSLTAGYGVGPGEGFPEQLQVLADKANLGVILENAGVSGDTTSGGLARLDWSVGDDADIVLIELGANDALRGLSPSVTRKNLEAMIMRLQERGINVALAGMLAPPNMGADYEAEFNSIYGDLAEKYDVPLYPFFLDGVAADASLNQADGIHPTAEGITVIATKFLPFLKTILEDLSGA